jgi:hypothetical protein
MKKRYVVGQEQKPGGPKPKFRRRWFHTLRQAEKFIAGPVFDKDKVGVENGDYYIDGPCPN